MTAIHTEGTTTHTEVAARFAGASKSFGAVRAVDGLDLSIERGETVALLGPNGAGKSTTIAMLLGLVPPEAGRVEVYGGSAHQAVADGRVGAMPQDGGLIPRVSVGELVGFVRQTYPDPLPLADVLAAAGLAGLERRRVNKLSGGQKQRVRFAMALAGDPDLLVLDEPTAALDVEARREFWTIMRARAARGHTVLFSTHYLEEADDNADRIVVIASGRLVAEGSSAEIKRAVGDRTVSLDLAGRSSAGLDRMPGVVAVEIRGPRAYLRTTDSDATVIALAQADAVRDLEVTGADLEDAFVALTVAPDNHAERTTV